MTQREYIGAGSILSLPKILDEYGSRKIFLVTGRKSYLVSGAEACLKEIFAGCKVCRFHKFQPNPKIEDVERGIDIFSSEKYDVVIAVGGGSTIDMAKAINFLAAHPADLSGYRIKSKLSQRTSKLLIAIPTTSGSGSEATHFTALYVNKQKHSIADERILPTVAIVDANLTKSLPKYTTAASGMDALSQAVESYWNVNSTNHSKQLAGEAIHLIIRNLPVAVDNPNLGCRLKMAEAAHLAGKAINITKTTAAHAVSYPLTSYFGIAHGHAVGLTLSSVLVFNAGATNEDILDKRGTEYLGTVINEICKFLGAGSVDDAAQKIDTLMQQIGLQTGLSNLGLQNEDIETIVANGFNPDRVVNNPRMLTRQALRDILERIY